MTHTLANWLLVAALALLLLVLLLAPRPGHAQEAYPKKYLSTNTDNATNVVPGRALLTGVLAVNTTAVAYYLKFYDKASTPSCGTDAVVLTLPVPPTPASGTPTPLLLNWGPLIFQVGLGWCLVAGIADNNDGAAAAGVAINMGVTRY